MPRPYGAGRHRARGERRNRERVAALLDSSTSTDHTPPRKERSIATPFQPLGPGLRRFLGWIPTWILLLIVALWTLPTAGLFVGSLRGGGPERVWWAYLTSTEGWTLGGYRAALSMSVNNSFAEGLLNQLAIAVPSTIVPLLLGSAAAYALVWIPFRGRRAMFIGIVALLAVPAQALLIPLLRMYSGGAHWTIPILDKTMTVFPDIGLAGSLVAVWVTHVGLGLPFAIFLLGGAMVRLPQSIIDAARADGASHLRIYWRIVLPLTVPALAGLGVLLFLWSWNDFLIALTMIGGNNPENLPATVKLGSLSLPGGGPVFAAGAFLHSAVSIAVFLALQRYFVKGLLATAE